MSQSSILPARDSEAGQRFRQRLANDLIAWLTLVADSGTPQPTPVWFLWDNDAEQALIYSHARARRLGWLADRPQASLHLDDDGYGHDFVVLTGTVHRLDDRAAHRPADENPDFVGKYHGLMTELFGEPRRYAAAFPTQLVFTPLRSRGH